MLFLRRSKKLLPALLLLPLVVVGLAAGSKIVFRAQPVDRNIAAISATEMHIHEVVAAQHPGNLPRFGESEHALNRILRDGVDFVPMPDRSEQEKRAVETNLKTLAGLRRMAATGSPRLSAEIRGWLKAARDDLARLDDKAYRILQGELAGYPVQGVDEFALAALVANLAFARDTYQPSVLDLMVTRYKRFDRGSDTGSELASALLTAIWARSAITLAASGQVTPGVVAELVAEGSLVQSESDLAGYLTGASKPNLAHAARVTGMILPPSLFEVVRTQVIRLRNEPAVIPLLDTLSRYGFKARPARAQIATLYSLSKDAEIKAKLRETLEKLSGRSV